MDSYLKITHDELFKIIVASIIQNGNCFRMQGMSAEALEEQRKAILREACLIVKQMKDSRGGIDKYLYGYS